MIVWQVHQALVGHSRGLLHSFDTQVARSSMATAINDQDCVVDAAVYAAVPTAPVALEPQKEREIDEVMEFLKFSVKSSTNFGGTILFKFKDASDAEPKTTYAVEIDDTRQVATRKNASARDVRPTCEVTISMDDFLWIYSGKATSSDMAKLFYAGRVAISGYAFRTVSKFAQSFDFSSEKWRSFYAWRKAQDEKNDSSRSPSALEEARNVGSPSRDYWFFHARTILDSYNVTRLQRLLWETSLASLFGGKIVLESVRGTTVRDRKVASGRFSVVASVVGNAGPVSAQSAAVVESFAVGNPNQTANVLFDFFSEDFVEAVKISAKERQQRRHHRNRVDLGDAGMEQLDKLVKVIGKGGHSNLKRDNRSKYVPAPELLLREFRVNVTVLMDTLKEKASGRKALHKIPAPEMDWLVRNGRSGSMVITEVKSVWRGFEDLSTMGDLDDHTPDEIYCDSQVFDIDFHPQTDIVAVGCIDGIVQVYKYSEEANTKVLELKNHQEAVPLYTASADKSIRAFDTLGNPTWAEMRAHDNAVNRLHELSANVFASGDDQGCVKIWDTRQHRCLAEFKEHTDYISGFATNPAQDHLLATSGDGRLSAYDLRKNALAGKSDELDDELLSVALGDVGRYVGPLPGHPDSVEALLKVDEDTVLTGSSDGIVRVVQLHPNKLLGLIGDHEDFPVENLKFSHDKKIIGSVSHTNKVHFWDVGYLFEEDGEDEADENEEKAPAGLSMDTEMQDADSDSDSDSDVSGMRDASGGRRAFPTANEQFFSDL
ncbi:WD40-repeat-containing domain [Phytophthora cactorum]|nr:WD40-repeat-containing domain [Phytophthora cactorum]